MKRIAYLLVNKDNEIFMENSTFNSLKKAEKQIEYGVKTGFYSEGDWKPKKIILDGQPSNKNKESQSGGRVLDEIKSLVYGVIWFIIFYVLLQWLKSGKQDLLTVMFFVSVIMLMVVLFYLLDFILCTIVSLENLCAWLKYKKQDTSDLESFSLEERVLLFREDADQEEKGENQ